MTVEPSATALTSTVAVSEFAGMVAEPGTVAMFAASELRETVSGTGVTADSFSVTFVLSMPAILTLAGTKLSDAVTFTG
jgi:hypothetical protein